MKKFAGLFAALLICSVLAFAQERGHEGGQGGAHQQRQPVVMKLEAATSPRTAPLR